MRKFNFSSLFFFFFIFLILFSLSVCGDVQSDLWNNGRILHFQFENDTSIEENGTKFVDISNMSMNNGTGRNFDLDEMISNGRFGAAVDLDGGNDYIDVGDFSQIENLQNFSFSGWINFDIRADWERIFDKYVSNDDVASFYIGGGGAGDNNDVVIRIGATSTTGGTNQYAYSERDVLGNGKWIHFVIVYDGTGINNSEKIKLYVNGTQIPLAFYANNSIQSNSNANNVNMLFGEYNGGNYNLDGKIDEWIFWNRTLTTTEITYLASNNLTEPVAAGDTTPPVISAFVSSLNYTDSENILNAEVINATDESGLNTTPYHLNDTTYFNISNEGRITNHTDVPVGTYKYNITAVDGSANLNENSSLLTVTITSSPDTQAPYINLTNSSGIIYGTRTIEFWFNSTDNINTTLIINFYVNNTLNQTNLTYTNGTNHYFNFTGNYEQNYTLNISSTDGNNINYSLTIWFYINGTGNGTTAVVGGGLSADESSCLLYGTLVNGTPCSLADGGGTEMVWMIIGIAIFAFIFLGIGIYLENPLFSYISAFIFIIDGLILITTEITNIDLLYTRGIGVILCVVGIFLAIIAFKGD